MVLLYSRDTCAPCKTLKYWLNKKGIAFKEFSLDVSEFSAAPTVVIDDEILYQPSIGTVSRALTLHNII
jgi:glutaredoxin